MQIAFREQFITIRTHEETVSIRDEFDLASRWAVRNKFDPKREKHGWNIHHILPIKLGGKSNDENLILIPMDIHAKLHEIIDWQIQGMRPRDKAYIALPIVIGLV